MHLEVTDALVALVEAALVLAGILFVILGTADMFLTILHPDRDGPVSVALNRGIWRTSIFVARHWSSAAREIIALAGALMIASTILLWMALYVLGFALIAWPFLHTFNGGSTSFVDAVYWSGVTFTTLGYGDITPASPLWRIVAMVEGIMGFTLFTGAITFLMTIFDSMDHRDKMALRMYSATGRTWDGVGYLLRTLGEEGSDRVVERVEEWADLMRTLHERLYRFQSLALYIRTRSEKHEPERMLQAVAEVVITAALLARVPALRSLRCSSEELEVVYVEFARVAVVHHGTHQALEALDRPLPTSADRERVLALWAKIQEGMHLQGPPWEGPEDERALLEMAARLRVFREELHRITGWHTVKCL